MSSQKLRIWGSAAFSEIYLLSVTSDPGGRLGTQKLKSLDPKIKTFLITCWGYLSIGQQLFTTISRLTTNWPVEITCAATGRTSNRANGLSRLTGQPGNSGQPGEAGPDFGPYLDTNGLPEALDWTIRIVSSRSVFFSKKSKSLKSGVT